MKFKIEFYDREIFIRYKKWWMPFWGWIGDGVNGEAWKSWSRPASYWSFASEEAALSMIKNVSEAPGRTIHVDIRDAT